mmetsp:Transcript_456/g.1162  ORF Transcript_456/g.1162 Transcript_456/m.1162 type:complete len:247 (+) Transcript_456:759-1499(+)
MPCLMTIRTPKRRNPTELVRMWLMSACRKGMAGMPSRPAVWRGRTPCCFSGNAWYSGSGSTSVVLVELVSSPSVSSSAVSFVSPPSSSSSPSVRPAWICASIMSSPYMIHITRLSSTTKATCSASRRYLKGSMSALSTFACRSGTYPYSTSTPTSWSMRCGAIQSFEPATSASGRCSPAYGMSAIGSLASPEDLSMAWSYAVQNTATTCRQSLSSRMSHDPHWRCVPRNSCISSMGQSHSLTPSTT